MPETVVMCKKDPDFGGHASVWRETMLIESEEQTMR